MLQRAARWSLDKKSALVQKIIKRAIGTNADWTPGPGVLVGTLASTPATGTPTSGTSTGTGSVPPGITCCLPLVQVTDDSRIVQL